MNLECHACIGGTSVRDDMKALGDGPHVVVGTPGRVQDMIQRRFLKTDSMKMFVLDEADEMLSVRPDYDVTILEESANISIAWFHRANLRHLPVITSIHPGGSPVRHYASGCS